MEAAWSLVSSFDNSHRQKALATVQTEVQVARSKIPFSVSAFGAFSEWNNKTLRSLGGKLSRNKVSPGEAPMPQGITILFKNEEVLKLNGVNNKGEAPIEFPAGLIISNKGKVLESNADDLRSIFKPEALKLDTHFKAYEPLPSADPLHRVHTMIIKLMVQKPSLRRLSQCKGDDAQKVLDVLQMFPSSVIVKEDISIPEIPRSNGHFGEVYKSVFHEKPVCLKVLKIYQVDDPGQITKDFLREVYLWNQLSHPNILPFYGAFILRNKSNRPCFISPWMEEGNVIEHIK
ncbi:hypothetical protein BDQ17DRAFT_1325631 [Cyathus striatus]|nr:hypothetical protein BDQ17DRAFT_1325631 [Cyathus striatus]